MARFAYDRRVLFWEEPIIGDSDEATLDLRACAETGVIVVTPRLPRGRSRTEQEATLKSLLEIYLAGQKAPLVRWYFTPMMLPFSRRIHAVRTVYDCMDEPAVFEVASPRQLELERELLEMADIVLSDSDRLDGAVNGRPPHNPRPLLGVDGDRSAPARSSHAISGGHAPIHQPRFGFFGVVDEAMDLDLLATLADARPEWSIIVGAVEKIDHAELPARPNIRYPGELVSTIRGISAISAASQVAADSQILIDRSPTGET